MAVNEYDYLFKVVLCGPSQSGKTSLLKRFTDDSFSQQYVATIGVDFAVKSGSLSGKHLKLQLWDTAGQERFRNITSSYYRGAGAVIVLCDLTDRESLQGISGWVEQVRNGAHMDAVIALAGSISDSPERVVGKEELEEVAAKNDIPKCVEFSSKTGDKVDELFSYVTAALLKQKGAISGGWWGKKPTFEPDLVTIKNK